MRLRDSREQVLDSEIVKDLGCDFFWLKLSPEALDIGKRAKRDISSSRPIKSTKEVLMLANCMKYILAFVLCLGLTLGPVWAQKATSTSAEKINLNSATVEQLQSLPGIGPATAKSIVEYRTKVGKFKRIEEIINVKGVGEKKFQRIKDRLVL